MAKIRGGGQVGSHRSRCNQGLEVEDLTLQVASATTLKVKKRTTKKVAFPKKNLVITPMRRSSRIKKVAAQDDEVEDVTPEDDEVEDVTPRDDEVEYVTPEDGDVVEEDKGNDNEADQAEKAMSEVDKEDTEKEGEACLTGQEHKEDEEEAANMEEDGVLNEKGNEEEAANMEEDGVSKEKGKKEEALNMEEDGVSNAQDDEIPSTEGVQLPGDEVKEKNKRGPTKMHRVAEISNEKIVVTFTHFGDYIGSGSVTLLSFLGHLVREHVPGRFNLQEEWQKAIIFKQLGNLWRVGKSRLVSQEISNKYIEMRKKQIPHTTSRKGMLRLAEDMVKE
ncbi:hypothetical protein N665_0337s0021 [Sinapis alba]|nr:hypothetical protein N665_0337s0021 [Sinapis alba]